MWSGRSLTPIEGREAGHICAKGRSSFAGLPVNSRSPRPSPPHPTDRRSPICRGLLSQTTRLPHHPIIPCLLLDLVPRSNPAAAITSTRHRRSPGRTPRRTHNSALASRILTLPNLVAIARSIQTSSGSAPAHPRDRAGATSAMADA